jgi:hypothetical protein
MRTVKVIFRNGTSLVTRINGTKKEITEYYKKGSVVNLGSGAKDYLVRVKKVIFL